MISKNLPNGKIQTSKNFGQCVWKRRKQQGLTQADLAGLCNVGIRFISELENGKPTIELGKAIHVARILGLELFLIARE